MNGNLFFFFPTKLNYPEDESPLPCRSPSNGKPKVSGFHLLPASLLIERARFNMNENFLNTMFPNYNISLRIKASALSFLQQEIPSTTTAMEQTTIFSF